MIFTSHYHPQEANKNKNKKANKTDRIRELPVEREGLRPACSLASSPCQEALRSLQGSSGSGEHGSVARACLQGRAGLVMLSVCLLHLMKGWGSPLEVLPSAPVMGSWGAVFSGWVVAGLQVCPVSRESLAVRVFAGRPENY